ncbi:hypothetical protein [Burkholderia phage vB_BpP_HN01]|uniref:Uncharacterized protein n=1 Tax=Burkholderia phage vB_BpP_HN02 TaxID=3116925 RepID=A0AAX4JHR8_9CAUD|nr:hypothetical protein [Burkholderia phage vB_BpP_HN01]
MSTMYGADLEAKQMYDALLAGEDVSFPTVDINDPAFQIKYDPNSPMYSGLKPLTNESLTQRHPKGDGTFDALMESVSCHLKEEFSKGRITGAEYTKAYTALTDACMQNAVQYLTQRDGAFWQGQLAQIQAVTAQVNLKTALFELIGKQFDALTSKANYALTKAKLATESTNFGAGKFQVDNILPKNSQLLDKQLVMTQEQTEAQRAQTLDVRTDGQAVRGVLGKQKDLYDQQITSYKRDSEVKAAKIFSDAWITQKTVDEGLVPPPAFENASVDKVFQTIKVNNGFV